MVTVPAGYPSEAFAAFDFLKTRVQLSVEDLQVLALIECYGEVFYETLARGIEDAEARALLLRNAQEERGHAHRVLKAITLKGGAPYMLPAIGDNPFMQSAPGHLPANAELFAMIEQGEVDGDLAYQAWADAEPDPEVSRLYRLNGREETRHCERVAEVRKRLMGAR